MFFKQIGNPIRGVTLLTSLLFLVNLVTAQEVLKLNLSGFLKDVRANHPKIKIEETKPEIKKTIFLEEPIIRGYGGSLYSDYQQNHSDSVLSIEQKKLNIGWNYKLLSSGTSFRINLNNTHAPINREESWKTTASFTINQPLLFDGILGNQNNLVNIKRFDYEISKVSFEIALSEIIVRSLTLYLQYGITKEINALYRELLNDTQDILKFNRQRLKIGSVSRSDILSTESQVIKNQIEIQNSNNDLRNLQEEILYSMGHPYPANQNITINLIDSLKISRNQVTFNQAIQTAEKERSEFQLYSLQFASAENAIILGKKSLFPKLDAFLTYSFIGSDSSSYGGSYQEAFKGLSLENTDIIWGLKFSLSTEVSKYKIATQRPNQLKEQTKITLINFQRNLHNNIRSKIRNLNNAYDVNKKNQTILKLTRERYNIAKKEYFIGKIDYTRLSQIETELKQTTINYLKSKILYYTAKLDLEKEQGVILKKYGSE